MHVAQQSRLKSTQTKAARPKRQRSQLSWRPLLFLNHTWISSSCNNDPCMVSKPVFGKHTSLLFEGICICPPFAEAEPQFSTLVWWSIDIVPPNNNFVCGLGQGPEFSRFHLQCRFSRQHSFIHNSPSTEQEQICWDMCPLLMIMLGGCTLDFGHFYLMKY